MRQPAASYHCKHHKGHAASIQNVTCGCSQVTAEKLAWELSNQHGFKLVTICPTFVIGPVLGPRADATSILNVRVGAHLICW